MADIGISALACNQFEALRIIYSATSGNSDMCVRKISASASQSSSFLAIPKVYTKYWGYFIGAGTFPDLNLAR